MILVSVGASEYPFDRLLRILDELCDEGIIEGKKIIAQIGNSTYIPKNYKNFKLISREEFQEYSDKAEYIITHAGTGSVVPPLKDKKKIIVFPRLEKYNEHMDNHQLDLCDVFSKNKFVLCAKNKDELIECIGKIKKFKPNPFVSNTDNFNKKIIEYIEI